MKVIVVSDKQSVTLKNAVKDFLSVNYTSTQIEDLGSFSDEYEQLAQVAVDAYNSSDKNSFCLLFDISGNGISMYANKADNVNACICFNNESVEEAVKTYNANMFAFSSIMDSTSIEPMIKQILQLKANGEGK